jgi:hypothetical protein
MAEWGVTTVGRLSMPTRGQYDRFGLIETEARKLARSGRYLGFESIQSALVELGYVDAPKIFANQWTCSELDRLCERGWQDKTKQNRGTG